MRCGVFRGFLAKVNWILDKGSIEMLKEFFFDTDQASLCELRPDMFSRITRIILFFAWRRTKTYLRIQPRAGLTENRNSKLENCGSIESFGRPGSGFVN